MGVKWLKQGYKELNSENKLFFVLVIDTLRRMENREVMAEC